MAFSVESVRQGEGDCSKKPNVWSIRPMSGRPALAPSLVNWVFGRDTWTKHVVTTWVGALTRISPYYCRSAPAYVCESQRKTKTRRLRAVCFLASAFSPREKREGRRRSYPFFLRLTTFLDQRQSSVSKETRSDGKRTRFRVWPMEVGLKGNTTSLRVR